MYELFTGRPTNAQWIEDFKERMETLEERMEALLTFCTAQVAMGDFNTGQINP